MSSAAYTTLDVPVQGGALAVGAWGEQSAPVVAAVHGITANHLSFGPLAAALPEFRVVAPDLRGRGRSTGLPGPWGMDRHAADVAAVIEAVGAPVLLLGHSMGGFVASALVRRFPGLVRGLLLVDGGLPLRLPPGLDADEATALTLGPALQRLSMTFPSRSAYLDFWRPHPALQEDWSPAIEAYLEYDLTGTAPELRSSVSSEAVAADSADLYARPPDEKVLGRFAGPAQMIVMTKGLLGQPPGIYGTEDLAMWRSRLPAMRIESVPNLNHYTILLASEGAERVAASVRELTS
jgi:lipase